MKTTELVEPFSNLNSDTAAQIRENLAITTAEILHLATDNWMLQVNLESQLVGMRQLFESIDRRFGIPADQSMLGPNENFEERMAFSRREFDELIEEFKSFSEKSRDLRWASVFISRVAFLAANLLEMAS